MANSLITAGGGNSAGSTRSDGMIGDDELKIPVAPPEVRDSSGDKRVWMYGPGGKAQIFERKEDVPAGEGWVDHPDKVKEKPAPVEASPAPARKK